MITLIAAVCENNAIGLNNELLYRISGDLKRFKQITTGQTLVMGRKTFESLPAALPDRRSIVVTRDVNAVFPGAERTSNLTALLEKYTHEGELYVIGGEQIYTQAMPHAGRLMLTLIDASPEADSYFPKIDEKLWRISEKSDSFYDERNKLYYKYVTYINNLYED